MTKQEKKVNKIMTFMSFNSKVDSCISPNNNYSKNNSRFQQNSLMDGVSDASKKKNIKNIAGVPNNPSRSLGQSFIHVIKSKVKSDKPLTEETSLNLFWL